MTFTYQVIALTVKKEYNVRAYYAAESLNKLCDVRMKYDITFPLDTESLRVKGEIELPEDTPPVSSSNEEGLVVYMWEGNNGKCQFTRDRCMPEDIAVDKSCYCTAVRLHVLK